MAAPGAYRYTFFFSGEDVGWSESVDSVALPGSTAALANLNTYLTQRSLLLSDDYAIIDVRISQLGVFRDIQQIIQGLPIVGAIGGKAAAPTSAVMLRMFGPGTPPFLYFRNLFLRGLPSGVVDGTRFVPTGNITFSNNIAGYTQGFKNGNWVITSKSLGNPKVPITGVTNTGAVTLFGAMANLVPYVQVQLLGVKRSLVKQRIFTVGSVASPAQFQVLGWPGAILANQGYFRLLTYNTVAIGGVTTLRISERRVGRPFGQPRGRAAVIR